MNKIIRINMSDLSTTCEEVPEAWAGLGGRALTSTIVAAEVPPTCHPLGPNNKLVLAPGLLTGTIASNSGRLSAGCKSPLTGTIKECNGGGNVARQFALLGIKAIIIEGKPKDESKWHSMHINNDGVSFAEETELIGQGTFATVAAVTERYNNKKIGVICVGPAGEMRMNISNISIKDPEGKIRSLGRGGLGALMGSKRIKFISVDDTGGPGIKIADQVRFKAAAKKFAATLISHPVSGQGLPTYGTAVLVNILNEAGGLPTRNFTQGQSAAHEKFSGETIHDTIVERKGKPKHGCHQGCVIQCSQVYNDKDGKYLTSGFEYETIWGLGADCCIEDLDDIATADNIMDDLGVDSIETPVMFGVAMEAGVLPFGDGKGVIRMLREEVGKGTPLGHLLGGGTALVGKAYGLTRVPVVKDQAIPAYDPRAVKGIGVTYAMSTQGADHTMGYTIATNLLNVGGFVDPLKKDGQVELSRNLQIATAAVDSTGMCVFIAFPALDNPECLESLIEMLNAEYDLKMTGDDVVALGKSVLKTEHDFNLRAGFTNKDDRLPEFFTYEPVPPHNAIWDFSGEELDAFWNF
jgi:aldehyde:ferredoxin oxidoreductase